MAVALAEIREPHHGTWSRASVVLKLLKGKPKGEVRFRRVGRVLFMGPGGEAGEGEGAQMTPKGLIKGLIRLPQPP